VVDGAEVAPVGVAAVGAAIDGAADLKLACVFQFAAQPRTIVSTSVVQDGLMTTVARRKWPYWSNPLMAPALL
jgi:hypothetical protein